jgi:hypothetical protein
VTRAVKGITLRLGGGCSQLMPRVVRQNKTTSAGTPFAARAFVEDEECPVTSDHPESPSPDEGTSAKRPDFPEYLNRAVLQGSTELRGQLEIDEAAYLRLVPSAHKDARAHFLYAVVDDLARVGSAMIRWKELSSGNVPDDTGGQDVIQRTALGAIITEQSLWLRKLLECLVDVICFADSNLPAYYRHYTLCRELESRLRYASELRDFYGKESANIRFGTARLIEQIRETEKAVEIDRCWYLHDKKPLPTQPKQRLLSSFRSRLKQALHASPSIDRLLLGLTYRMYAEASEDIHFTASETHRSTTNADISSRAVYSGLLATRILLRSYRLVDVHPKTAFNKQVHRVFANESAASGLLKFFAEPIASPGDFVLSLGALAELRESYKSSFGYYMYRVEYIATPPIADIEDEWVLPEYIRLLFRRSALMSRVSEVLSNAGVDPSTCSDETINRELRQGAVRMWEAGLKEYCQW